MNTTLRKLFIPQPKSKIKAGEGMEVGNHKFFTSSSTQNKFLNDYQYDEESLIFGTGGAASVHYCNEPFSTSTDCIVVYGNGNANLKMVYYYLSGKIHLLQNGFKGAGLQHISKDYILNIPIDLPDISTQNKIVESFDMVAQIIKILNEKLLLLDEIVKSRFIEMFGELGSNPKGYPSKTLAELCSKITDGKHGGCETEAGTGRFFVGAREIYDGVVHYDTAPEITVRDFEKDYKRCNIEIGDFLIVNTGATIGKSAIATDERTTSTLLQKSVALLKVRSEQMLPIFLRYCYMANPKMYMVESASAQPNLLLSKIKATTVYVPLIDQQQVFASFVADVDKSKFATQKALTETQQLFDSLMQKYFG